MSKNLNMTQGNPLNLLFVFALPLMFGNVFQQLYTVVDVAIVGRGVGMDALAALGTVDWLNWMMLGIAQGYTQGFSVPVSQKFGEGDFSEMKRMIARSALLSAVIAVIGTLLVQLGLPLFLLLLRVPAELMGMATLYSRILMGGFAVTMFYNFCSAVLRAVGNSKTPLIAMVIASVTNIVLDLVAVFVLGWGIAGAAGATVFAQGVAGTICAVKLWKTPELRFSGADLKSYPACDRKLLALGSPVAAKNTIIALGGMGVQTVVNGFGMSFIAGYTATNKLYGLLEIAALSYGYAITTYVGQNYGAANYSRIRSGVRSAVGLSLGTSALIAVIMVIFGRPITGLFISSEDPVMAAQAGEIAYVYLCMMAICLPALYLLYVYLSALQGMGNTVIPMVSGFIEFGIRVGISVIIGFTGFEYGIFGAEVGAWVAAAIFLSLSYYRRFVKLNQKNQEKTGI